MRPRGCRVTPTTFPSAWTSRCRRQSTATTPAPPCCTCMFASPTAKARRRCRPSTRCWQSPTRRGAEDAAAGRRIDFVCAGRRGAAAKWPGIDTRHLLAELTPKPDQVTIVIHTNQMSMVELMSKDDIEGTSMSNPEYYNAYKEMVTEAPPSFRRRAPEAADRPKKFSHTS